MFNLLVKYSSWANGRDTIPSARTFEYTEQSLVDRFKPEDQFDFVALTALSTLFVEETSGQGNQVARVGTITRARMNGHNIALEYTYDLAVPAIPNKILQGFAAELDIEDFQFSRTHWSVKDVDLFRALLRNAQPRRQRPKVFQLSEHENIEPSLVSAILNKTPAAIRT